MQNDGQYDKTTGHPVVSLIRIRPLHGVAAENFIHGESVPLTMAFSCRRSCSVRV